MLLQVSEAVPEEFCERAENVLIRLHLRNDERVMRQREVWYLLTETKKRGHLIIWGAFSACLEKDASGVFSVPVRCFWSLG
ncbi:MAG: hypothetical protein OXC26_08760, partial [Albidovulum sp.]|nr:hypothetical protein [Albidovulum sp.]